MSVLALIPARGGSKGIPRKNVMPLAGRPLITYSLEAARKAATITDILVSTDDAEIAACCEAFGVPVPYRRPPELAGDTVGMVDTSLHALDWWQAQGHDEPEILVLLQPTSPLRSPADIDGTVKAMRDARLESAISVHEMAEHPCECIRLTQDRGWSILEAPPPGAVRRQDWTEQFHFINGAVYAVTPAFLRRNRAFCLDGRHTAVYAMDRIRGIDIDDPIDLDYAEATLTHPRLAQRLNARTDQV